MLNAKKLNLFGDIIVEPLDPFEKLSLVIAVYPLDQHKPEGGEGINQLRAFLIIVLNKMLIPKVWISECDTCVLYVPFVLTRDGPC